MQECVDAAKEELSSLLQEELLRSASYGKRYWDAHEKSGLFLDFQKTAGFLRVLNALRAPEVGLYLTAGEFEVLRERSVISRLCSRRLYYLSVQVGALIEWKRVHRVALRVLPNSPRFRAHRVGLRKSPTLRRSLRRGALRSRPAATRLRRFVGRFIRRFIRRFVGIRSDRVGGAAGESEGAGVPVSGDGAARAGCPGRAREVSSGARLGPPEAARRPPGQEGAQAVGRGHGAAPELLLRGVSGEGGRSRRRSRQHRQGRGPRVAL